MDRWVAEFVADHRPDWLVTLAKVVTELGSTWLAAIVLAVVVIAATHLPLPRRLLGALGAWFACDVVVDLLKASIDRARPAGRLAAIHVSAGAMPSAHAARAALVAGIGVLLWRRRVATRWLYAGAAAVVVAVAWSRVELGVHWLSDVVVGSAVGFLIALASAWIALRERDVGEHRPVV